MNFVDAVILLVLGIALGAALILGLTRCHHCGNKLSKEKFRLSKEQP